VLGFPPSASSTLVVIVRNTSIHKVSVQIKSLVQGHEFAAHTPGALLKNAIASTVVVLKKYSCKIEFALIIMNIFG
jgi:non-ribosomal peptide synthetase component E (peptide arylation enzyme)